MPWLWILCRTFIVSYVSTKCIELFKRTKFHHQIGMNTAMTQCILHTSSRLPSGCRQKLESSLKSTIPLIIIDLFLIKLKELLSGYGPFSTIKPIKWKSINCKYFTLSNWYVVEKSEGALVNIYLVVMILLPLYHHYYICEHWDFTSLFCFPFLYFFLTTPKMVEFAK